MAGASDRCIDDGVSGRTSHTLSVHNESRAVSKEAEKLGRSQGEFGSLLSTFSLNMVRVFCLFYLTFSYLFTFILPFY